MSSELRGVYVLFGFRFVHDFEEDPLIISQRYHISEHKIRYNYNMNSKIGKANADIFTKMPLTIIPDVDEDNIIAYKEGVEEEEESSMLYVNVRPNNQTKTYALGFEISYFGKDITINLPRFHTRIHYIEKKSKFTKINNILQDIWESCSLSPLHATNAVIDFISVPRFHYKHEN